jgi:hypothetical protein
MTLKPQRDAETSPPSLLEGLGMIDNPIVILPLQGVFLCHPDLVGIPLGCWTKFGYDKKKYNKIIIKIIKILLNSTIIAINYIFLKEGRGRK